VTSHIYSQVAWCTRIQSPKLGRLSPIQGKAKLGRLSSIQGKTAGCRYMPNNMLHLFFVDKILNTILKIIGFFFMCFQSGMFLLSL
jgi:hypothetical protein